VVRPTWLLRGSTSPVQARNQTLNLPLGGGTNSLQLEVLVAGRPRSRELQRGLVASPKPPGYVLQHRLELEGPISPAERTWRQSATRN